ncbi:hypothetical protein OSSY52_02000 [Tepiditoga spiralis]|uniref:Uncharacterized protein n=1 Tax=Tepiditoga spiralis TaxID=2108365 RepID=A0A7G1G9Q6_9BACT|nr:hypothetical protein [Tepiditoga spiralis]BBE30059.1 hypothetical protein OSSY52_02000 [Tepiditoga spiralis]
MKSKRNAIAEMSFILFLNAYGTYENVRKVYFMKKRGISVKKIIKENPFIESEKDLENYLKRMEKIYKSYI